MPKIYMPRAFVAYDPARHMQSFEGRGPQAECNLVGLDYGSGAPCVAVRGVLYPSGQLHVWTCYRRVNIGLDAFIAQGWPGVPATTDLIAMEAAAINRSPTDLRSPKQIVEAHGHRVLVCGQRPIWRLHAIQDRLRAGGAVPMLAIDPRCEHVHAALIAYRAAAGPDGVVVTSTPRWQHTIDALGYLVEAAARWRAAQTAVARGVLIDQIA